MSEKRRYPLAWPAGWKRMPASQRQIAHFSKVKTDAGPLKPDNTRDVRRSSVALSVADATRRLEGELDRLGAAAPILSTNQELRLDGTPRSDRREPSDPGAAVYFKLNNKPRALACDRWTRVADNIAAIAQHIDALRRIERYGVGTMEQAFAGYASLPASPTADWWLILNVTPEATADQIDNAYRRLARKAHPDTGGSHSDMARLNAARDAARAAGQ